MRANLQANMMVGLNLRLVSKLRSVETKICLFSNQTPLLVIYANMLSPLDDTVP
jgi:hypothetical protein